MVEPVACVGQRVLKQPEIDDHTGLRIGLAPHRHLGAIGMAMDALARFCPDAAVQSVRGVEADDLVSSHISGYRDAYASAY